MNEPIKTENTDIMSIYQKSDNILSDIQNIIETSRRQAYHAVDTILSQRNCREIICIFLESMLIYVMNEFSDSGGHFHST